MSEVNQSFDEFLCTLCKEPSEAVLSQVKCPLIELFDKQANIDRAKKELFKPELGALFRLYLEKISTSELEDKINQHRQNFLRGFGRDRFNHLKLLVRLKIIEEQKKPKKGLLAV
jgi:hypothetical protein